MEGKCTNPKGKKKEEKEKNKEINKVGQDEKNVGMISVNPSEGITLSQAHEIGV